MMMVSFSAVGEVCMVIAVELPLETAVSRFHILEDIELVMIA